MQNTFTSLQLESRNILCLQNNLCFVSLQPLLPEDTVNVYHHDVGGHVPVHRKYCGGVDFTKDVKNG